MAMMKSLFFCLVLLTTFPSMAQQPTLSSGLFDLSTAEVQLRESGKRMPLLLGASRDFDYLEMHATTLLPSASPHEPHAHDDIEELIIVKEGQVEVSIGKEKYSLSPGSIALIMPGDWHGITNQGTDEVLYYTFRYRAKATKDDQRGKEAGGSLVIPWEEVPFRKRDKGGVRSFFERPTAMCERFEMHVTTLNAGLQSHPPHTHRATEIILMIEGRSQEQIGEQFYEGEAGDFYFLESESLHTIRNIGQEACTYFAFQFN
jgi:(S)-ureidoglycine aminohydrolase